MRRWLTATVVAIVASGAWAEAPSVTLELNRAQESDGACRLTFMAESSVAVGQFVVEAVIFTASGEVERLTLFDLGELPAGRARVRQFNVPGLGCGDLGQVLINGIQTCDGQDPGACLDGLAVSSRVDGVELAG